MDPWPPGRNPWSKNHIVSSGLILVPILLAVAVVAGILSLTIKFILYKYFPDDSETETSAELGQLPSADLQVIGGG